jgi:hypothetical protein
LLEGKLDVEATCNAWDRVGTTLMCKPTLVLFNPAVPLSAPETDSKE